jgi:hypothetical protein
VLVTYDRYGHLFARRAESADAIAAIEKKLRGA